MTKKISKISTKKSSNRKTKGGTNEFRYEIEKIDVDGDGINDGDLIKQIRISDNKVIAQKFVPIKKIQKIVNNALEQSYKSPNKQGEQKQKIIYVREPKEPDNKPVIIQDQTNFSQYVKQGVGMGVGWTVGETVTEGIFSGIGDLFE